MNHFVLIEQRNKEHGVPSEKPFSLDSPAREKGLTGYENHCTFDIYSGHLDFKHQAYIASFLPRFFQFLFSRFQFLQLFR
jgi:hypothetical protein